MPCLPALFLGVGVLGGRWGGRERDDSACSKGPLDSKGGGDGEG